MIVQTRRGELVGIQTLAARDVQSSDIWMTSSRGRASNNRAKYRRADKQTASVDYHELD
jgi:hypothetical protein